MEKIVITPKEVRALGNIVSPKSKNDFLGSKISQGTATVQGIPSTVYTCSYLPVSKLTVTGKHYLKSDNTLKLNITVTDNHNTPIHSGKVYCTVNNATYNANITSSGTCTLNIPGLIDGLHTLKIYYPGTTSIGGSFRNFTVVVGDDLLLELFITQGLMQKGDYSELFGIFTSEGIGVPGVQVKFYERFTLSNIRAYASAKLLQTGVPVDINARVSDVDGSGIAEQLVEFYEEFDINFNLIISPELVQAGGYSEVTARLSDGDGSPIRDQQVDFYETYDLSTVKVNSSNDLLQTGTVVDVYGVLSDSDGSRVPDTMVMFFEEFEFANLSVMSTNALIQDTGTVDISARLSDSDGSAIPDTQVMFYEYYELDELRVRAVPPVLQVGEVTDIGSVLCDSDGSRIRGERVDYSKEVDSTDWSMVLNTPPDTIQVDDTIDITATVKDDNDTAVSGIYVRFYYNKKEEGE